MPMLDDLCSVASMDDDFGSEPASSLVQARCVLTFTSVYSPSPHTRLGRLESMLPECAACCGSGATRSSPCTTWSHTGAARSMHFHAGIGAHSQCGLKVILFVCT